METFRLDIIKDFMLSSGGKVKNHELVTQFKPYLNHPTDKAENRRLFKDFVNTLATIKVEDGEKILVLKKRFREEAVHTGPDVPDSGVAPDAASLQSSSSREGSVVSMDSVSSSVAPPNGDQSGGSSHESSLSPEERPEDKKENSPSAMNVKERAKHLNKIVSETDISVNAVQNRRKDRDKSTADGDEDGHPGVPISLNATEREWLILSSSADYQPMAKLLNTNHRLAKKRDFTSGYTALHWAAKHGKMDVVKLIAGTKGVKIDAKSYGGYTPLHLAAQHGHENIIELLVQTYQADPNIRDYSGKKAKMYLKNSASSKAQLSLLGINPELLQAHARKASALDSADIDEYFRRGSGTRQSTKALAVSSAIQGSRSALKSPGYRKWGSSDNVKTTPNQSPSQSPSIRRKGSLSNSQTGSVENMQVQDGEAVLMPPPRTRKIKKNKKGSESDPNIHRSESDPDVYNHPEQSPARPISEGVFY